MYSRQTKDTVNYCVLINKLLELMGDCSRSEQDQEAGCPVSQDDLISASVDPFASDETHHMAHGQRPGPAAWRQSSEIPRAARYCCR